MEFLSAYLPYLILGGLFLLMMRYGGCCGGHGHGGYRRHGEVADTHGHHQEGTGTQKQKTE